MGQKYLHTSPIPKRHYLGMDLAGPVSYTHLLGTASERGKSAVLLTVTKQPATSTLELTDKLEASLKAVSYTHLISSIH